MLKSFNSVVSPLGKIKDCLLKTESVLQQSFRTTFILKRRFPPPLSKKGQPTKNLRQRYFIYDLVKDTNIEKRKDLEVILIKYVEGVGHAGDRMFLRPNDAYNNFILPGLAVYASPENIEKYANIQATETEKHSSPTAKLMADTLSRMCLSVVMNKETPWTLKPWHIRASFRKCGFHVPDECIKLPDNTISGPNMNIENKEFFITVTINNLETAEVRCRIHHWSTDLENRLPHVHEFWKIPSESVFAESSSTTHETNTQT